MTDTIPILTLDLAKREVSATQDAINDRDAVLLGSALIARVANSQEQEVAVQQQRHLKHYSDTIRNAAKSIRGEINPIYDAVGSLEKQLLADVDQEGLRLAKLIGDFAESERIRVQARTESARADIAMLQRMEQEELAAAPNLEAQDEIREKYARLATTGAAALATEAPKAKGQVVREDWEITVTDKHVLYQFHANCVRLEPKLNEIKKLLNSGLNVNGVSAVKVTSSFVRNEKEKPTIEINESTT